METETNEMAEAESAESEGTCQEAECVVNEATILRNAKDKTVSRPSGKKYRKPMLNRKALLQAGLQSNAKKASSRKL